MKNFGRESFTCWKLHGCKNQSSKLCTYVMGYVSIHSRKLHFRERGEGVVHDPVWPPRGSASAVEVRVGLGRLHGSGCPGWKPGRCSPAGGDGAGERRYPPWRRRRDLHSLYSRIKFFG